MGQPCNLTQLCTQLLRDRHAGLVPRTLPELLALPGVGPKMALIVLRVNTGEVAGVSVDTHVHRICNQLGWVGPAGRQTKTPEQTRAAVEGWLPRELWDDFNLILVGIGQEVRAPARRCLRCKPFC